MAFATEAARWRALVTRDANANGHFIYSVKSTSIYCRPTCPGRLARRANVGFYETAFEAEAAGFRACKRCKPNTVSEDPQERAVDKACLLIDEALMEDETKTFRLQDLANMVGLTPRYLHKIFKDRTGFTPKEYAKYKQSHRSSSSATPVLSTSTDGSIASWDFGTFDFNDMIDYGALTDKDTTDLNAHEMYTMQSNSALETQSGVNNAGEAWNTEFQPSDTLPIGKFAEDWLVDPFASLQPATIPYDQKSTSIVSTFKLDAAALLSCDDATGVVTT